MDPRDATVVSRAVTRIVQYTEVDAQCEKLSVGCRKYCRLSSADEGREVL